MEAMQLAQRAVACKHWRWKPGMLIKADEDIDRICIAWEDGMLECRDIEIIGDQIAEVLPDLDDPATLGCLLALVREAWGDQRINTLPTTDGGWAVADGDDDWICTGMTETEALVAALEAAP